MLNYVNKDEVVQMDRKVIFATGNPGKLREIRMIMGDMGLEIVTMKEAGFTGTIVEDGTTFEENALIKAGTIAREMGEIAMADDSGLEIDALGGEPGIYSARYLGEDTSYDIKNQVILDRMKDVPEEKRTARFVCAAACVFPDGRSLVVRETMEGRIGYEIVGTNVFGYDPVFYLPEFGCTSAQISPEQKNAISHRGKALRKMRKLLLEEFGK